MKVKRGLWVFYDIRLGNESGQLPVPAGPSLWPHINIQ